MKRVAVRTKVFKLPGLEWSDSTCTAFSNRMVLIEDKILCARDDQCELTRLHLWWDLIHLCPHEFLMYDLNNLTHNLRDQISRRKGFDVCKKILLQIYGSYVLELDFLNDLVAFHVTQEIERAVRAFPVVILQILQDFV